MPVTKKAPATGFQSFSPLVGQSQKGPGLNKAVRNYFRISQANLQKITKHIKPLPSNATPAQRQAKLQELFNLIRIGGKLGIQYQYSGGRKPKTPDEVLKPSRGMKADCDELAMLFVAAARHLNIGTKGISMGGFQFTTSGKKVGHAALFVSGKQKHIFDFTKGKIIPVADFSTATVLKMYKGTKISYGQGQAGQSITGLSNMNTFGNVSDMAGAQLLLRADHLARQNSSAKLEIARNMLESVAAPGSANAFIKKGVVNLGLTVFDRHHRFGNNAYSANRYKSAESLYKKALELFKTVPALKKQRAQKEYSIHERLGLLYQKTGKSTLALAEFGTMIKLNPKSWSGYMKKMNLEVILAKAALRKRNNKAAKRYFSRALVTASQALKNPTVVKDLKALKYRRSKLTYYDGIRRAQRRITAYMKRRGWK